MNSYIDELQEQLDDYTDDVLMEIIEDRDLNEAHNLRNLAEDAMRVAKDLAEELNNVEGR